MKAREGGGRERGRWERRKIREGRWWRKRGERRDTLSEAEGNEKLMGER